MPVQACHEGCSAYYRERPDVITPHGLVLQAYYDSYHRADAKGLIIIIPQQNQPPCRALVDPSPVRAYATAKNQQVLLCLRGLRLL